MEIGVLGPLHVIDGGNPLPLGGPKQRAVLGLLVAGSDRTVSVDEVVEGVWGDAPPKSVLSSLHSYISHLRSDAGLTIERNGDGYRLITETDTVDALAFEALIGQARDVVETDAARAADLIAQGLDLWRGHPYADLPDMLALEPEKKRLDHLRFGALDLEIEAELVLGRNTRAAERLERLIADHPFHEGLRAAHMLVLYRQGRQVAALNLYQDVRRLLLDELGVEPSPALQAMEHRILIQDPSLLLQPSRSGENGAVVPGPPGRNPYKGLAAFDIDDARDFHGRDDEIDELVKLVHAHRFVLVVGPSGRESRRWSGPVCCRHWPTTPFPVRSTGRSPSSTPVPTPSRRWALRWTNPLPAPRLTTGWWSSINSRSCTCWPTPTPSGRWSTP